MPNCSQPFWTIGQFFKKTALFFLCHQRFMCLQSSGIDLHVSFYPLKWKHPSTINIRGDALDLSCWTFFLTITMVIFIFCDWNAIKNYWNDRIITQMFPSFIYEVIFIWSWNLPFSYIHATHIETHTVIFL